MSALFVFGCSGLRSCLSCCGSHFCLFFFEILSGGMTVRIFPAGFPSTFWLSSYELNGISLKMIFEKPGALAFISLTSRAFCIFWRDLFVIVCKDAFQRSWVVMVVLRCHLRSDNLYSMSNCPLQLISVILPRCVWCVFCCFHFLLLICLVWIRLWILYGCSDVSWFVPPQFLLKLWIIILFLFSANFWVYVLFKCFFLFKFE